MTDFLRAGEAGSLGGRVAKGAYLCRSLCSLWLAGYPDRMQGEGAGKKYPPRVQGPDRGGPESQPAGCKYTACSRCLPFSKEAEVLACAPRETRAPRSRGGGRAPPT